MQTFIDPPNREGSETVLCRCLQVTESTVVDAIAVGSLSTVKEICCETGAGGGCTACHARLRELLSQRRERARVC
jgi:NAD(P)H-nitrite reductase large subunit